MIQDIVLAVESHFSNNWTECDVNYEQPNYTPTSKEWLELVIIPLLSTNNSLTNCTFEDFEIHTLVYSENKVKAGILTDKVVAFLQNTNIGNLRVKTWGTISNGNLEDNSTYFYKIYFDAQA